MQRRSTFSPRRSYWLCGAAVLASARRSSDGIAGGVVTFNNSVRSVGGLLVRDDVAMLA